MLCRSGRRISHAIVPAVRAGRRPSQREGTEYRGKQAKTGNSLALGFDRALFKSHPEFNGGIRAGVIAPGRLLVS
jgi:hypothetical protein